MKIGILTHHYINNFGAFLQAYALQQAVGQLYPEAEVVIIDYLNLKHFIINTGGWFRIYKDRETPAAWWQKIHLPATFSRARRQYLRLSKRCFFATGIEKLGLDCIIVGSDEVWNYQDAKGNAKLKFGHGLACRKLVAYAPSVGQSDALAGVPDYVREGMKRFTALSARDDLTQTFIEKTLGVSPARVLDPTFLSAFPLAKPPAGPKPYILFYYCEQLPEEYRQQIATYAKENGLAIYGAGECDKRYDAITVNLAPFEWVQMFRDAQMVFTGTFHGTVFSILNQKPFFCHLTNPSRIKKVGALLGELGITGRILSPSFSRADMPGPAIDYDAVYARIKEKKQESLLFLRESIGEREDG